VRQLDEIEAVGQIVPDVLTSSPDPAQLAAARAAAEEEGVVPLGWDARRTGFELVFSLETDCGASVGLQMELPAGYVQDCMCGATL
jgi:hypothetical protein